jgi:hypothetical protein
MPSCLTIFSAIPSAALLPSSILLEATTRDPVTKVVSQCDRQKVGHHRWHLMVNERVAQATALIEEAAGAAASFANPDAFRAINSACGWF